MQVFLFQRNEQRNVVNLPEQRSKAGKGKDAPK